MPSDKLERLMGELQTELERERETSPEALARWYQGVLEAERRKGERRVSFIQMLRAAHGLGDEEGDDSPPAA